MSDAEAPRLRAIEAVPIQHEGEQYVALRDPAGYTPSVVMLPPPLLELVALFDGEHSIVDIQAEIMKRHGELVTREHIEKLIAALDEHGFLETPAFAARRDSLDRAFLDAPSRPASHAGMRDPFALTRKDYDTPLGPARVDRDFVEALAGRARQDCFASELAHRNEHSIEFQAVFLQYLYTGRRDVSVVPVLTSFVHEALARGQAPEDDPRVRGFLDALAETVAASGRRVAFIAGADLAHMGTRFGDPEPVSAVELERIGREDRAMLESVEAGDAHGFFESVRRDNDRRRICGLSPIYTLLRALGGARGTLRRYGQWPDPEGVVTFASLVY